MDQAVFGLIGCGGIARNQHLPNLTRAPHARLKTVCDLDPDRLRTHQQRYGVPEATRDYHEVLADDEIQAVVIATREDMQVPLTIEALQAGKHVYVEKPLATEAEACERVVAAQEAAGKLVAVGLNRRFAPALRQAKEALDAHGGARNIHYRICDEYWRWGKNLPDGVRVIHEICHVFDVIRWIAGSDVRSVYCVDSRADDEIIVLTLDGCVAAISDSGYGTRDLPKEMFWAAAEKGAVEMDDFVELRTFGFEDFEGVYRYPGHTHPDHEFGYKYLFSALGSGAMRAMRRQGWELARRVETMAQGEELAEKDELLAYVNGGAPDCNYMMDKGWLHATEAFAQCVLTGRPGDHATAADALAASRLAHAAIESRRTGQPVAL